MICTVSRKSYIKGQNRLLPGEWSNPCFPYSLISVPLFPFDPNVDGFAMLFVLLDSLCIHATF